MRNWKGVWVIVIAILHSLFAFMSFGSVYIEMLGNGLIDSVNSSESAIAAWFFLFGILILALGIMIYSFEKNSIQIPNSVGLTLLALSILGAAVMPISGFWLLFPPVLAILYDNVRS